ncbi:MAG: PASTA domain-containing protein [Prevotella sp.]|nr:PASTA domain-containing protein [Prevotella sp.]
MSIKGFIQKIRNHYLTTNLLAMGLVVILLCVAVAISLGYYTHHGENIVVPDLKGMTFEKAYNLLEKKGIFVQVSDSGYNKQLPANTILIQTPNHGMRVKEGRTIYVTVNSPLSPTFALPDIVDNCSLREAEARLSAMGFRLTAPQEVEGEKDWVYGIVCRGRRVSNGDRISIDNPLTLLVGKGMMDDTDEFGVVDEYATPEVGEIDEFEEVTVE